MRKLMIVVMVAGSILIYLTETSMARPTERYDERTKMCRFLADGRLGWESEPWGTGGVKFREVCKSCHSRNNDKGAPFLHSESYTSAAWNEIFTKRRKKCAREGYWDVLTEEELQYVNDYLFRNGNWTYDPYDVDSCG